MAWRRWLVWAVLALPLAAAAAAPPTGTSFEVGPHRFLLARGGALAPRFTRYQPAEGRWCLMWRLDRPSDRPALWWPPLAAESDEPMVLSVMMRADRPGLTVRLAWRADDGRDLAAGEYSLSTDWRRYQLVWPAEAGQSASGLVEVTGAAEPTSWWLDDLRIGGERGAPGQAPPEMSVRLRRQPIRWAGQSVQFVVQLRSPRAQPQAFYRWRLDSAAGRQLRESAGVLDLDGGVGQVTVSLGVLPVGGYCLRVATQVDGTALEAADSLVLVDPQLADPPPWLGMDGPASADAVAELLNLRVGLVHVEITSPEPTRAVRDATIRARHDGLSTMATWTEDAAVRAAWDSLIRWWQAPLGELFDPTASTEQALGRAGQVPRGSHWSGVRLAAEPGAASLLAAAEQAGLLKRSRAVQLALAAGPPDQVDQVPWDELRQLAKGQALWLMLPKRQASSWSVGSSLGTSADDALAQAAWLAQALLLARWHQADAMWYPGRVTLAPEQAEGPLAVSSSDLCDNQGRPQPGLAALAWGMSATRGRSAGQRLSSNGGLWALLWRGRQPLATLWSTGSTRKLELTLDSAAVQARDLGGTPLELPAGRLTMEVGAAPIYLEVRRGPGDALEAALRAALSSQRTAP